MSVVQALDDSGAADPWRRRTRRSKRQMPLWQELPLLLIVAFCLAVLIRTFLLQAFFIPSGSMEDTLLVGDRVVVNKVVYNVRNPQRGEVVVFRGTDQWVPQVDAQPPTTFADKLGRTIGDLIGVGRPGEKDFIKRVIALPGDRVSCCDDQGRVLVNGTPLDESAYVLRDSPLDVPPNPQECRSRRFEEIVVPPGHMFVLGDHRQVSLDARCQGTVPIDNVVGRAFAVVWPSDRWNSLPIPETFATVAPPPTAGGAAPVRPDPDGGVVLLLPIAATLSVLARSGRWRSIGQRRLLP
ncbi:signal peptidase I [Verrucosispora sp. WMMD1129]|nr:signal peptidase I [Verrucosispora sp. WMMD1129]WFE44486.1 signal peptidase I [Verrucosispora sp. WMMD1129]